MRGSLKRRSQNGWTLIFDLDRVVDPATGLAKRRQKWVTFKGTKKQAQDHLTEILRSANRHEYVEPSKTSVVAYLRAWVEQSIKPPLRRPSTYASYTNAIEVHIAPSAIAHIPLQQLRSLDLDRYYASVRRSPGTVALHHAIIHTALKRAVRDGLVTRNVSSDAERPKLSKDRGDAREHCWTATEARLFLDTAKAAGARPAAFYTLALDCGARKGELGGLRWSDVNLDAATITVAQQLTSRTGEPTFAPTKTSMTRTVSIAAETVTLLREHKRQQAECKMKNRQTYEDHGLVFAKEAGDTQTPRATLGQPLSLGCIGEGEFGRLIKASGVRRIKFHGLRHTSATLSLQAGTPVHVVAARLGHANPAMTLTVYAHALPGQQAAAAERLGALLHG
jgi:integrase